MTTTIYESATPETATPETTRRSSWDGPVGLREESVISFTSAEAVSSLKVPQSETLWQTVGPYVRVIMYAIACLTTSCVYFGWQPFSEMLLRKGAYSWLCGDGWDFEVDGACTDQDKAVTRLYSFAQGSEFICAFVAGLLLDHLGPRFTALTGELIFAFAILLICLSNQSFQLYIPAFILSGCSVNIVAFPSLVVTETWPSRQALAVSIIVGAQSGASVVALVLKTIWDKHTNFTYFGIWGIFLIAIWLPVAALYILALPRTRNYAQLVKHQSTLTKTDPVDQVDLSFTPADAALVDDQKMQTLSERSKWKAFFRDLKTIDLIVVAVFMFCLMLQFAYYPSVVRDAISQPISDFVGWMTPLQAPFSVVIGFIMDYTGTCLVMYAMAGSLMFVSLSCSLGSSNNPLQRFVAILFVFMQSATYNLKYTFVTEMYDPFNFGKLVGFLGIMGGIGVYVNAPIATKTNYDTVFYVYVGLAAIMAALTTFVYVRQLNGVTHKTIAGVQQKHRKQREQHCANEESV